MKNVFFTKKIIIDNLFPFGKFCFGGVVNLALNTGGTYLLTEKLGLYYLLSFAIIQTILIVYGFFYNLKFTFNLKRWHGKMVFKFLFFIVFFYCTNLIVVKLFTDIIELHYILSIILTVMITILIKFYAYKNVVFK